MELDTNDELQSIPPERTARNRLEIVMRQRPRGIRAVLMDQRALGRAFGPGPRVRRGVPGDGAARRRAALTRRVGGGREQSALEQADGLHLKARGVQRIAARLAPVMARALR